MTGKLSESERRREGMGGEWRAMGTERERERDEEDGGWRMEK